MTEIFTNSLNALVNEQKYVSPELSPQISPRNSQSNFSLSLKRLSNLDHSRSLKISTIKHLAKIKNSEIYEYLEEKIPDIQNYKIGDLEGQVINNLQKIENFVQSQYFIIDIQNGIQISNNERCLIKVYNLNICKHILDLKSMETQLKKLIKFNSPYCRKLYYYEFDDTYLYLVHEQLPPDFTPLYKFIGDNGNLSEPLALNLFFQLLVAVNHIHVNGLLHCDINARNILVNAKMELKLVNMGLGFNPEAVQKGFIGDQHHYPQELQKERVVNKKTDQQSLGVVLQIMLSGCSPQKFENRKDQIQQMHKQENKKVQFTHKKMWNVSLNCKAVMQSMLEFKPEKRSSTFQALTSQWFKEYIRQIHNMDITQSNKKALCDRLQACTKMKPIEKVFRKIVSKQIKTKNFNFLSTLFLQIDSDFSGIIGKKEFIQFFNKHELNKFDVDPIDIFKNCDVDNSDSMDFNEFIAYLSQFTSDELVIGFQHLIYDIDPTLEGGITQTNLQEVFANKNVAVSSRDLHSIFKDKSSKLSYDVICDIQYEVFFENFNVDLEQKEKLFDFIIEVNKKIKEIEIHRVLKRNAPIIKNDKKSKLQKTNCDLIDWKKINDKLPYHSNLESTLKRRELFLKFDADGDGNMSGEELRRGIWVQLEMNKSVITYEVIKYAYTISLNIQSLIKQVESDIGESVIHESSQMKSLRNSFIKKNSIVITDKQVASKKIENEVQFEDQDHQNKKNSNELSQSSIKSEKIIDVVNPSKILSLSSKRKIIENKNILDSDSVYFRILLMQLRIYLEFWVKLTYINNTTQLVDFDLFKDLNDILIRKFELDDNSDEDLREIFNKIKVNDLYGDLIELTEIVGWATIQLQRQEQKIILSN